MKVKRKKPTILFFSILSLKKPFGMLQWSKSEQGGNEGDPIKTVWFNPRDYFYYWFLRKDNSFEKGQDS